MDRFLTPACDQQFELVLKKSRFVTSITHAQNKEAAKHFLAQRRAEMCDANHHCWAMVAGAPDDLFQNDQSDDGEPKGTAGKPMLNVIQHSGLGHIVVVVSRYFGGVKLGAGGLVRAYTKSVTHCLPMLQTRECFVKQNVCLEIPFCSYGKFEYWLQSTHIEISSKNFNNFVQLELLVPLSEMDILREMLSGIGVHGASI